MYASIEEKVLPPPAAFKKKEMAIFAEQTMPTSTRHNEPLIHKIAGCREHNLGTSV